MGRKSKYPPFVMFMIDGNANCSMILQKNGSEWEYWRDGGAWGVHIREENGKLYSDAKRYGEDLQYLDGCELVPITEQEWREADYYARSYEF